MVSPASKDTEEDLQKAAGASEGQAPGEQELLPAGQAQVHSEVGEYSGSLKKMGAPGTQLRHIVDGLGF